MKKLVFCTVSVAAVCMAGTTVQTQDVEKEGVKKGQRDRKGGKVCCRREEKTCCKKGADKKTSNGYKEKANYKTKTGCKDVQRTKDKGGKKK